MINLILLSFISWTAPSDSLRMETIKGKQYIIHQIEAKETLYSISRRYNVPISAILENNPSTDGGLAVGKLLKVPFTVKAKSNSENTIHIVAAKETLYAISRKYEVTVEEIKTLNNMVNSDLIIGQELMIPGKSSVAAAPKAMELKSVSSMHTVAAKETMYSIARQYGISVNQLKEWNNLQDTELPIGKMLIITQPTYNTQKKPTSVLTEPPAVSQNQIKISESVIGTDEIKEQGMAEMMEGTAATRKYLALHRTIKPGTILKVRNEANNKEVFVRISGALPMTTASDIVVRISKSAYDRLGAADLKFRIEMTYYK